MPARRTYNSPRYGELILIVILGALQPLTELLLGERIASFYNAGAAAVVLLYVAFCVYAYSGILKIWGIRLDNFRRAIGPHLVFAALGSALLYGYGWTKGNTPLPTSFWIIVLLYPLWGFAQQFALQNLVVRNLAKILPNGYARAALVALVFGVAHIPSLELVILAGLAGFFFTFLYNRYPNLIAIGIAHGIVGALVFYAVLGQDQAAILMRYLGGGV
jgi:Type II CAAX prenyl endopeptidase Rce1-like